MRINTKHISKLERDNLISLLVSLKGKELAALCKQAVTEYGEAQVIKIINNITSDKGAL